MVVNYCGYCGAAARPHVRFCRQCGFELATVSDSEALDASATSEPSDPVNPPVSTSAELNLEPRKHTVARVTTEQSRQPGPSSALSLSLAEDILPEESSVRNRSNGFSKERQPRATALAQASGLEGTSAFSSRIRAILIALAVVTVGVASLVYYRQSLRLLRTDRPERNLVTPEEQSLDLIRRGKQANEFGQYLQAVGYFKDALALTPQHLPIYLLLAESYQASGQVDEALRSYWTLLRQDPQNLEARLEVAEVHRARGNWREAYQEYQRIIAINSQSLEAAAALALIEGHDQRPFGLVRGDLPKNRASTRHKLASLLPPLPGREMPPALTTPRLRGESLAAPPAFLARAEEERGDVRAMAESHKVYGKRFLAARLYTAAIQHFSIAQSQTPDDKDLYYLLASSYDGLGQAALAHEFYKQCDSGPYAQVARSGAQKTAKAARNEIKKQDSTSEVDTSQTRPNAQGLK